MRSDNKRLGWLLLAALAATMVAAGPPPASAQTDATQAPAAGLGTPVRTLPATAPGTVTARAADAMPNAVPDATPADAAVPPTHRETVDDCMGYWDTETHMSKAEWRAACQRTLNGTDMGGLDLLAPEPAAASKRAMHRRSPAGSRS